MLKAEGLEKIGFFSHADLTTSPVFSFSIAIDGEDKTTSEKKVKLIVLDIKFGI